MYRAVQGARLVGATRSARLKAEVVDLRKKIASGQIESEQQQTSGQQGTVQNQKPRKLTIGDLGLPFIPAEIAWAIF